MKSINIKHGGETINITIQEAIILYKTLTYVFEELDNDDFSIRVGVPLQLSLDLKLKITKLIHELMLSEEELKELEVDANEYLALSNVLNEILNGFSLDDFEQKMGVTRETVSKLFSKVNIQ